ncbi:IgaA/UmoB family intracellular growth attenuator [Gilliamella intestini]|uniref:Intracellular growth attenuator protein IgaA n=1 Tax=Gilliamella intestini TaxID=1798183 RepID=A0A1C4B9S9_9GAMM|nr:IgaA/UmoB family intracellular growth attenuator [Gilliamella intestini]SCC03544.1 Intracellular growth attenuator protein IgaA [Gilliamella intestini]
MEFYWLFKVFLIGLALFSWISYRSERHQNKQNLNDIINERISIRKLTEDEFQLLQPYLDNKWLVFPYKYQSSLIDLEVSKLAGNCVRHSLYTNTEETSFYYEIGGIELFFPYNMYRYITAFNVVEVVFTKKYAFVVKINDYDIKTVADSQDGVIYSELDEPWLYEQSLDLETLEDDELSSGKAAKIKSETDNKINYVQLLEREETSLESKNRNKKTNGILSAFFLVSMTVSFLMYWYLNNSAILFLVIFSFIFFILFYWYQPKSKYDLYKVNCIKGLINNKKTNKKEVTIGKNYILKVPHYWLPFLPEKSFIPANMDVTVDDRKLIRYENTLSINQEIEQFGPPKFVKRNLILFITGIILSAVVYFQTNIVGNALLAYRIFNQNVIFWKLEDESVLKNSPIQKGDLVNIQMRNASCDVNEKSNEKGCHTLFINDQPIENNHVVSMADQMKSLFDNNFIDTHIDRDVMRVQQYQDRLNEMYKQYDRQASIYSMNIKSLYTKLKNIGKIVTTLDKACNVFELDCHNVRKELSIFYNSSNWQEIVKNAEKNPNYNEVVDNKFVSRLDSLISTLKKDILVKIKDKVSNYQHQKSSLRIDLFNYSYKDISTLDRVNNGNLQQDSLLELKLNHYYDVLLAKAGTINIIGLVKDIYYQDNNTISGLKVDANYCYSMNLNDLFSLTSPVLISLVIFSVTSLISFFNGIIMCYKLIANRRRQTEIIKFYKNRII